MTTHDPPHFGDLLRRLRTAATLSQEELAERAGLSVRGLSDLERGVVHAPRLETVRLLADALALADEDRAALVASARPELIATPAAARARPVPLVVLPVPPARLIGREAEVVALCELLMQLDVRLVTLTGPGGTGKTRLALEVAAEVRDRYPDGVCFVDLSPLRDPALVVPTIAATLGVREVGGQPLLQTLAGFLTDKRLLLLLDNCEQVVATAPDVATLLAASPTVSILATSRASLHIRGEREVPLLPLSLPAADRVLPIDELAQVPAVALFVDLASASWPDFALTAENAIAVASICRRLDGLPLAIELAAARIKVLPPAALLARLEQRLPLLTGGGRDLPARQRTMRDTLAWSYDLLAPAEQRLFRRLAVFAGGFTLAAAAAVAETTDAQDGGDVLEGVAALVEQSLLRSVPGFADEPRYRMLETVREFGLERLAIAGENDETRARHASHFLELSGEVARGSRLFQPPKTLAPLAAERDNLRLVLTWLDARGDIDALLQLVITLYGLFFVPGLYREGLQWLERILDRSRQVESATRVHALAAASGLSVYQGEYDRASMYITEALRLARKLGEPVLESQALVLSGLVAYRRADYATADALLDEAYRRLGDRIEREPDAQVVAGMAVLVRGDTALAQEQCERAGRWYERALGLFQASGDDARLADAQAGLGATQYCQGELAGAAAAYATSLAQAHQAGYTMLVASSLLGLAGIAAEAGRPDAGARLLGAAEEIAASRGSPIFPRDEPVRGRACAALTAALGPERLVGAREAGRALSVEAAMAVAQAVTDEVMPASA